jgi:hypothetical protein
LVLGKAVDSFQQPPREVVSLYQHGRLIGAAGASYGRFANSIFEIARPPKPGGEQIKGKTKKE